MKSKSADHSRIDTAAVVLPEHITQLGIVHGGDLMKMMDNAAGIVAHRHCRHNTATVSVGKIVFKEQIQIGDVILCYGELVYTGRTSMVVLVKLRKENLDTGEIKHVVHGYWVMVALDDNGIPTPVPQLIIESPEQQELFDEIKAKLIKKDER